MDFSYTEEQQMLQDSVQKFVQNSYDFETRRGFIESEKGFSEENWQLFAELGWLTVPFSEEDGGFGGSAVDLMVMMTEFGKAMLVEPYLATAVLGGGLVSALASDEQKAELLPALMEGKLQLALASSEPGSRFNLASVSTSLSDGSLSGEKIAVLNGGAADKLLVVARTSGESQDRDGISIVLIDRAAAGVSVTEFTNIDGQKSANISFDNVQVADGDFLGAQGEALTALEAVIDRAALAVSAEAVGAMQALLSKTVEYSKTRKQFNVPIGTFQALQHRMADMFIQLQLAQSIVIMAAMALDTDDTAAEKAKAVSAAKSRVGQSIRKVGQEAVQIHGGIGVTDELDVGHFFKRVTAIELSFGNTDFHTNRYAKL